jgi:hypothetical protein
MGVSTLRSVLVPKASTRVDIGARSRPISLSFLFVVMCAGFQSAEAAITHVNGPGESIQAAIDIANDGDVILIAAGTYTKALRIESNVVTLTSRFFTTENPSCIADTIIYGTGHTPQDAAVLRVASAAPDGSRVIGLTISNGDDGISASSQIELRNSVIRLCGDGLDYDGGGGGLVIDSVIEDNFEDGIDIDGIVDVTIQNSVIRNNRD